MWPELSAAYCLSAWCTAPCCHTVLHHMQSRGIQGCSRSWSWWHTAVLRAVIIHVCFVRTYRCNVHSQPHFQAYVCAQAHWAVCQRARTLNWTVQQPRRRTPFSRKLPRGQNRSLKCRCSSTFTSPIGFGSETGCKCVKYDYLCDDSLEQYRVCRIDE